MKKYIERLGNIIEDQIPEHPKRARNLLSAAYTWVAFSSSHNHKQDLHAAYNRINGTLADTMVASFRQPQSTVMVNLFMPCELLHALKLQPMFPEGLSAYLACTACQNIFAETAEAKDIPETFCSYHKTMLGIAKTGVLPAPLMIADTTLACDANQLSFRSLADLYHVPHTVIDVPFSEDAEAVHYVAAQLMTLTEQLEDLCHRKLSPERLQEVIAYSNRTITLRKAYLKQRGAVTLPSTLSGELCSMAANHVLLGRKETEMHMKELIRAAEKAPSRESSRKKRIFWCHTLPIWQDSMKQIFESDDRCEIVGNDLSLDWLGPMNPDIPYESMARRILGNICNGPSERRIEAILHYAKVTKTDGIILFCHWGCKQTLGMSQQAKLAFEAAGFPTLILDGDGCDSRNVADGQMVTRVNAFLEQLEEK